MNKPAFPVLRSAIPLAGILRGSILILALSLCGCAPLALGPRVLRTETAGLAALAALQTLWGDFSGDVDV